MTTPARPRPGIASRAPSAATAAGTPATPGPPGRPPAADALAQAAERVGDRWSLQVIGALLAGPRRFGDLQALLDGIAPNILSQRLTRLERDGLVVGEPYSRRPVRHTYRLTAAGADLAGAVRMLAHWGATHRTGRPAGDGGGALTHARCGTALEARWFCPTCGEVVDDPDTADLNWI
ncbi:MAG TPA: helix-turn-helix domain-containing protein [Acidimicrobiales bacterium]